MKRTTNYDLPTWEKDDFIRMQDFNDLTDKLDAALKSGADAVADEAAARATAITQALGTGGQNCRVVVGSYTGNGKHGAANKITVSTGFKPLLFVIFDPQENQTELWLRGTGVYLGGNHGSATYAITVNWANDGLSWYAHQTNISGLDDLQLNVSGSKYWYLVLGA